METKHLEETDKQATDDLNDEGIGKNNGGDSSETVNTGEFQDFTPRDDIKIDGKLKEAFDYALNPEKTKITNIGLLGRYSSGKSSSVDSYLKQRKDINYVKISFAHFKSNENGTDNKNIDNITNSNVLEKKIVNQLINLVDYKKINQTSFYVKRKITYTESIAFSLLSLLSFICLVIISKNFINFFKIQLIYGIVTIILTFSVLVFLISKVYVLIKSGYKFKFSKLELDVNKNDDNVKSYFDVYLTEIIYVIENSGLDLIIFEDIDRFEITSIFERLHEVNGIVNRKLKKYSNKNKCVKFLYLVKDELFDTEDKVKFFDFIIPAFNVINKSNTYDFLCRLINDSGEKYHFDHDFLKSVCEYITDIRVFKNIYNEFVVYYDYVEKINNESKYLEKVDDNKIFAIVIYKNFFKKDFYELQNNEGTLYYLIFKVDKDSTKEAISEFLRAHESFEDLSLQLNNYFEKNFGYIDSSDFNVKDYFRFLIILLRKYTSFNLQDIELLVKYVFETSDYIKLIKKYKKYGIIEELFNNNYFELFQYELYIEMVLDQSDKFGKFSYHKLYNLFRVLSGIYGECRDEELDEYLREFIKYLLNDKYNEVDLKKDKDIEKYLNLFSMLLSYGYLDGDILFYTAGSNFKIAEEHDFIRNIKNTNFKFREIEFYLDNFEKDLDFVKLVTEVELIYWYDNLNILNFKLLDYLLVSSKGKNKDKRRLNAFISNLIGITDSGDLYFQLKNKVIYLFSIKYYCSRNDELRKLFLEELIKADIKFYKLNYEDDFSEDKYKKIIYKLRYKPDNLDYYELFKLREEVNELTGKYDISYINSNKLEEEFLKLKNRVDELGVNTQKLKKRLSILKQEFIEKIDLSLKEKFINEVFENNLYITNIHNIKYFEYSQNYGKMSRYLSSNLNNLLTLIYSVYGELFYERIKYVNTDIINIDFFRNLLTQYVILARELESFKIKKNGLTSIYDFLYTIGLEWLFKVKYNIFENENQSYFKIFFNNISKYDFRRMPYLIKLLYRKDIEDIEYIQDIVELITWRNNECIVGEAVIFENIVCRSLWIGFYSKCEELDFDSIKFEISKYSNNLGISEIFRFFIPKLMSRDKFSIFKIFIEGVMGCKDYGNFSEVYQNNLIYQEIANEEFREHLFDNSTTFKQLIMEIINESPIDSPIDSFDFSNFIREYNFKYLSKFASMYLRGFSYNNPLFIFSFRENGKNIPTSQDYYVCKCEQKLNTLFKESHKYESMIRGMNYYINGSNLKEYLFIDPEEFNEYDFDRIDYIMNETYYFQYEIENVEIDLVKEGKLVKTLNFEDYIPAYYKDKIIPFLEFIITSNEINNDKYEEILSSIGFRDDSKTYEIKLDKNTKINDVIRKIANDEDKVGSLNEDKLEILTKLGFREE